MSKGKISLLCVYYLLNRMYSTVTSPLLRIQLKSRRIEINTIAIAIYSVIFYVVIITRSQDLQLEQSLKQFHYRNESLIAFSHLCCRCDTIAHYKGKVSPGFAASTVVCIESPGLTYYGAAEAHTRLKNAKPKFRIKP